MHGFFWSEFMAKKGYKGIHGSYNGCIIFMPIKGE